MATTEKSLLHDETHPQHDSDENPGAAAGASEYEQLRLKLYATVDLEKIPPERGLWRELLSLAGAKGPVHHICWILYGRMDSKGHVRAKADTLAADGGIGVRTVHRSLTEAKRIGVVRWRRRRGASWYELNLSGGFSPKRQNCLTGRSEGLCTVGKY